MCKYAWESFYKGCPGNVYISRSMRDGVWRSLAGAAAYVNKTRHDRSRIGFFGALDCDFGLLHLDMEYWIPA